MKRIVANFYCMCALALSLVLAAPHGAGSEPLRDMRGNDPQAREKARNRARKQHDRKAEGAKLPSALDTTSPVCQPDDRRTHLVQDFERPENNDFERPKSSPVVLEGEVPRPEKNKFFTYSWEEEHGAICQYSLSAEPFVGNIVTSDVSHLPAIYAWASETKSHPLVLVDRTGQRDHGLLALAERPRNLTIAYGVASDMESLTAIHQGEDLDASALMTSRGYASGFEEWQKLYKTVRFLSLAPDRHTGKATEGPTNQLKTLKERLIESVQTMESNDLLVILAHNVDGELRFGDGSVCSVGQLSGGKGKVWVLSCGTFEYLSREPGLSIGTTEILTYKEAVAAVRRTLECSALPEATFRDILVGAITNEPKASTPVVLEPPVNAEPTRNHIFGIVDANVIEFKCGHYA
jgi:hypothetical protein